MIERADTTPRFAWTGMRRLVTALVICAGAAGVWAQDAGPDGGPFWEMGPTSTTPHLTGTGIELVDGTTLRLHDGEPHGRSVVFRSECALQAFGFHASDNRTNRIQAVLRRPAGACVAGPDSDVRAQLQLAMLEPVPHGQATVAGPCFGARSPGITLIVAFGDAPPR
ncbi:MAG: hypothetical protein ACNS61_12370 [Candidatus Wenzhouxiangella sp. M2_3B_020]